MVYFIFGELGQRKGKTCKIEVIHKVYCSAPLRCVVLQSGCLDPLDLGEKSHQFNVVHHIFLQGIHDAVQDDAWLHNEFIKCVQQRGGAVIKARKLSSAMSAAKAIGDHMRDWWFGTGVSLHYHISESRVSCFLLLLPAALPIFSCKCWMNRLLGCMAWNRLLGCMTWSAAYHLTLFGVLKTRSSPLQW